MHDDLLRLDLTFPSFPVGDRETVPDLTRLLYKGGASIRVDRVAKAIEQNLLGSVQLDRVELVFQIHSYINGNLAGGGSSKTALGQFNELASFFGWADKNDAPLNLSDVSSSYIDWTEHLLWQVKITKHLTQMTAYHRARKVGQILDNVLDRERPISSTTRIKRPRTRKTPQGVKAEKQNLHTTFAFGRLLQDICDGTTINAIRDAATVCIPLQQGGEIEFKRPKKAGLEERSAKGNVREMKDSALLYEAVGMLAHRFVRDLINLRIQAELLMYIGQTSMNLAQAQNLRLQRFSYSSDINGYKVREYKKRRNGEVLFEIFSEYRSHFERYLEWRRKLVPSTEARLFPFIRKDGTHEAQRINFGGMRSVCKRTGVKWTSASVLRGTRVNWLLRRSGDADITAEIAQHHTRTLLSSYAIPSQQRAISEITRFHLRNDPALFGEALMLAVAPGECDGIPNTSSEKPKSAPEPDCRRASGCLWCDHHRDIDSFEYVWSLACFRHLKILELSKNSAAKNGTATHPADNAIQRLSEKLSWFRNSNTVRAEWVEEAFARVEEADYCPQWSYLIESVEGTL